MKKYIPYIILTIAVSIATLSCRQNDMMDEVESQIICNPEDSKYFSQKLRTQREQKYIRRQIPQ
ncbi:hypothetical protein [Chryseobacterium sp. Bi04]|uniref:hypothetical protein n=1 Tax=Chryseobacterium sp. Bi04 TaxID=2822345 RepID=UPI001E584D73|nr:hypothetical protein [Chryseobacterium sp. Bi04]